jgi:hypothetical protein
VGGRNHHAPPPAPQFGAVVVGQWPWIGLADRMRLAHEHVAETQAKIDVRAHGAASCAAVRAQTPITGIRAVDSAFRGTR